MKITAIDEATSTLTVEREPELKPEDFLFRDAKLDDAREGTWTTTVDPDAGVLTLDTGTPTVTEALERLAGRRALSIELQARVRVVTPTVGQCRKTRRNNLRILRAETKAARRAAEEKARLIAAAESGLSVMRQRKEFGETYPEFLQRVNDRHAMHGVRHVIEPDPEAV